MESAKRVTTPVSRSGYTKFQWTLNATCIALFVTFSILTIRRIVHLYPEADGAPYWLALAAVSSLLFADFVSGFFHWLFDNWGSTDSVILGNFVRPFRHHHAAPEEMVHHSFVERHGDACLISLPTFGVAALAQGDPRWILFISAFMQGLSLWVLMTNQVHAWAHQAEPPRVVRTLQRARIILSPVDHALHHKPPHATYYCITTGWLNPLLARVQFFERIERTIRRLGGPLPAYRRAPPPAQPVEGQPKSSPDRELDPTTS